MQGRWLTIVLATLLVPAALAGTRPGFGRADANDDQRVSLREARRVGVPLQDAELADLDEDGMLTRMDWKFVDAGGQRAGQTRTPPKSGS